MRRLHIETLEARLVLSGGPLDVYNQVSSAWFGRPASPATLQAVDLGGSEWIVRLTPQAANDAGSVAGAAAVLGDLGFSYQVARGLGLPGQLVLKTSAANIAVRQALESNSAVASAGLNASIHGAVLNPDDTSYAQGRLFGLNLTAGSGVGNPAVVDADIDAPEAWVTTTGSSSIVVAVLDSGIDYNHEDLAPNIWTSGGSHGYDFVDNDPTPLDANGHGTHVAGIIGAKGNNGLGTTGVNWNVSLMSVRVLGANNSGDIADAIEGINYVTSLASGYDPINDASITPVNIRVINASWAVDGNFVDADVKGELAAAIQSAGAKEILVVVAAGNGDLLNNGVDLNTASFLPAAIARDQALELDNLIVVAASDPYDRITPFSNYGAGVVDLAAPGDDILSTLPGNLYGYRDGTSMATPFVSGVAALMLASTANADLSAADVKDAILKSVDPLPTPEDRAKVATGGRLNANNAVNFSAFPPRAALQSAADIVAPGATTHTVTVRYTGRTNIAIASVGVNDIVVRRGSSGTPVTIQGFSHAQVGGNPKVVDVTYTLTGPGDGVWNGLDNGEYQIEVVEGSVADSASPAQTTLAQVIEGAFSVNIQAGVFVVQRTDDAIDTNPGNGLPDIAGPGSGFTLRAALQEANLVPGAIVIVQAGTYTLTRIGANEDAGLTGDLDVTGNLTVIAEADGQVVINGNNLDRVFDVRPLGNLTLNSVTVMAGRADNADGGGVRNLGQLTVERATIRNNVAETSGGGIYNDGTLTVLESSISQNTAAHDGGGLYNAEEALATITASTIDNNTATSANVRTLAASPDGPFRVNSTTTSTQYLPNVGMNAAGDVAVTWTTQISGFDQKVHSQRVGPTGNLIGSEQDFTTVNTGPQLDSSVAVGPNGQYAVTYQLSPTLSPIAYDTGIRTFNSSGAPVANGLMHTPSAGTQGSPVPITLLDGSYAGVWVSGGDVISQRYSTSGVPTGTETGVPQTTAASQEKPDFARFDDNQSVVVWADSALDSQPGNGGTGYGVYGRIVNSAGNPTGSQFALHTQKTGDQTVPSVAADANGFVATWRDAGRGIIAQRFNRTGTKIGGEILVVSSADLPYSQVAMLKDGGFAVAYSMPQSPGFALYDIWVQAYDSSGEEVGTDIKLNTQFAAHQTAASIASDGDGKIIVAWSGSGSGDGAGIYARYLTYSDVLTGGDGGGIYNAGTISSATNVTISGNDAANQGGGLLNAMGGQATVNSATVTNNLSVPDYLPFVDPTFSIDGFDAPNLSAGSDNARAMAVQPDGKVVIVGDIHNGVDTDFGVVRYNADGTLDATFGGDGIVTTNFGPGSSSDHARGVAIQADGKIVVSGHRLVGGNFDFAVARYNPDGTLDATFDGEGLQTIDFGASTHDEGKDVVVQSDGKIVVAGYSLSSKYEFAVARFNANGSLDTSFSGDGKVRTDVGNGDDYAYAVAIVAGKIVVAGQTSDGGGTDFAVVRYNADGSLDTSFSGDGQQITSLGAANDEAYDVVAQADGKIVVAGFTHNGSDFDFALVRYDVNGALDASFDSDGRVTTNFGSSNDLGWGVAMQGGKIVVAGDVSNGGVSNVGVARYNADGSLDATFDGDGKLTISLAVGSDGANSVAVIGDDRYYLAGYANIGPTQDMALLRIGELSNGVGIANATGATLSLKNSIVATGPAGGPNRGPDVVGHFESSSGNLIGNVGAATGLTNGINSNIVGSGVSPIDPKLGPLANNGGPTKTHQPETGSPAIDAGISSGSPAPPAKDQRGVTRPVDGDGNGSAIIDIGAVEIYYAAIHGKKFHDRDSDGVQDVGEENLQGWTIFLDLDNDGRLDPNEPSAITDAGGEYHFVSLEPGTYRVAEVLQPGWERTYVPTTFINEVRDDGMGGVGDGLAGASALASAAAGRFLYVAGAGTGEAEIGIYERHSTTGALSFVSAKTTPQTSGGFNVLEGVAQLAVGTVAGVTYLYALSPNNALTVFIVDTSTGALNFSQLITDTQITGGGVSEPKQWVGSTGLTVSSDGTRVYVSNRTAVSGGAIFAFERTGATLTFRRRLINNATTFGAGGASVVVSPIDNLHVYVAGDVAGSSADTIGVFERVTTGSHLIYKSVVTGNVSDTTKPIVPGLSGVSGIAISSDGRFVYVSARDDDAVTVFERNLVTGALTFLQSLASGAIDYLGNTVSSLEQASAIALSGDGARVYVARRKPDPFDPEFSVGAISVFQRDSISGRLSYLHELVDSISPVESIDAVSALLAPDEKFLFAASGAGEDAFSAFRRDTLGRDSYTLTAGQVLNGVDFSNRALPGAIRGKVFEDRNANQIQNLDEPSLSGWEVYLDLDGSGTRNSVAGIPEPLVLTDSTGVYSFEGLSSDSQYTVRLLPRSGWIVTAPTGQFHQLTISPGEDEVDVDFGVKIVSVIGAGPRKLEGIVFQDLDGNKVQTVGEPGIPNLTVYLDLDEDGVFDVGVEPVSNSNNDNSTGIPIGRYLFPNVPEATFTIRIANVPLGSNVIAPIGNALSQQEYVLSPSLNPTQVVKGKFDSDGDEDLAVLTLDGVVSIYSNNGSGVFAAPIRLTNAFGATSIAVGDLNGDGKPDIVLASSTDAKVAIAMNQSAPGGAIQFSPTYSDGGIFLTQANWDVVVGNFAGDSKADIVLAQRSSFLTTPSTVLVFASTTTGLTPTFAAPISIPVGRQPRALEAVDLDGNSLNDIVVVNQHDRSIQALMNQGGTFVAQGAISLAELMGTEVDTPFSLAVGHFNGDAKPDIVVGNSHTSAVTLLSSVNNSIYGPGGWTLGQKLDAKGLPRDVTAVDIDGDGDRDILAGTVNLPGVTVLRNIGTATTPLFAPAEVKGVANLQTADLPGVKSLVVGDFLNNGGLPDVAAALGRIDAGLMLVFSNQTVNGAHRVLPTGQASESQLHFAVSAPASTQPGDFDGDDDADGFDFLKWQRSFGGNSATGADADGNGIVNGADLAIWKGQFGATAMAAGSAALTVDPSEAHEITAASPANSPSNAGWFANDRALDEFTNARRVPAAGRKLPRGIDSQSVLGRRFRATDFIELTRDDDESREDGVTVPGRLRQEGEAEFDAVFDEWEGAAISARCAEDF